jgi:hypothetical protein
VHHRTIQINHQPDATIFQLNLNVKLRCQKVNRLMDSTYRGAFQSTTACNSFAQTSLLPFNRDAYADEAIAPSLVKTIARMQMIMRLECFQEIIHTIQRCHRGYASVVCEQNTTQDDQKQSFCTGISIAWASNTSHTVHMRHKERKEDTKYWWRLWFVWRIVFGWR